MFKNNFFRSSPQWLHLGWFIFRKYILQGTSCYKHCDLSTLHHLVDTYTYYANSCLTWYQLLTPIPIYCTIFRRDTAQKMKFSIKDFLSKWEQIRSFLWIWSHLLKKSLKENFIFHFFGFLRVFTFLNFFISGEITYKLKLF